MTRILTGLQYSHLSIQYQLDANVKSSTYDSNVEKFLQIRGQSSIQNRWWPR